MSSTKMPLLWLALLLAGCAHSTELVGGGDVTVVDATELPPPTAGVGGPNGAYLIGPLDKLEIEVFGIEGMRREVQVDAGGNVSFPLAGTIQAGGKSIEQLANAVQDRLRGIYMKDPHVTVNLKDTVNSLVTIEGAVVQPGNYPVLGRTTLMRAVANAKGLTDIANAQHAVVFRTVGGQQMAALYSLQAIREGMYADPDVYANDVVLIGESGARRVFKDVLQAAPLLTTPIIALLQTNSL